MLTAQQYRLLGARLRGGVSDNAVRRAVRNADLRRAHVGDSMKFAGGPAATSQNVDRGPSPVIWDNFRIQDMNTDPSQGSHLFDDFLSWKGTVAANVGTYASAGGGYKSFETTSATIKQANTFLPGDKTKANGVLELTTVASTANASATFEAGDGNGGSWGLTGNVYPKLAFECRVYFNLAAFGGASASGVDFFFGLAEKGLAVVTGAGSIIAAADSINQKSYIGFYSLTATAAQTTTNLSVLPAYGKNAVAGVPVTNGFNSGVGKIAPKTWTKLGFVYDPNPHGAESPAGLLKFYQDGNLLGWVTDCSVSAFPTKALLTALFAVQNDTTGTLAQVVDIDWYRVACQVGA